MSNMNFTGDASSAVKAASDAAKAATTYGVSVEHVGNTINTFNRDLKGNIELIKSTTVSYDEFGRKITAVFDKARKQPYKINVQGFDQSDLIQKADTFIRRITSRMQAGLGKGFVVPSDAESKIIGLSGKLSAAITNGIPSDRIKAIFAAIDSGNISTLGKLQVKEQEVINTALRLKAVYDGLQKTVTKTTAQRAANTFVDISRDNRVGTQIFSDKDEKKILSASLAVQKLLTDLRITIPEIESLENHLLNNTAHTLTDLSRDHQIALKTLREFHNTLTTVQNNSQKTGRQAQGQTLIDQFKSSLGGIQANFTQTGVINIERAGIALQKLFNTTNISPARMNELFLSIKNGSISALGTLTLEEKRAEVALRSLSKAFDQASTAGKRSQEVMINFQTALRIIAIQQLHLVISKITQALQSNQQAASEFGTQIALIQTITQKAALSTEFWAASLTNLSNSYGIDLLQGAAAAYEAASNQISKGAGITVFLADAFTLARTAGATAAQSVNILSSAINAYGGAAFEASRLSATLFKIADLGRVKVGEMANTFGNTATLAKSLGINLNELGASISTLTIQGIRYDTSATLINNIILKLIKPTEAMNELFGKWGVSSGQAAIATYGFGGVLKRLGDELASGGLARIGDLESDLRAIRSVVGQTGGNAFEIWTRSFGEMTTAQEEFDKAAKITAETVAFKLNKELISLHNLFITIASTEINKIFLEFSDSIGGLANNAKPLVNVLLNLVKVTSDFIAVLTRWSQLIPLTGEQFAALIPTLVAAFTAYRAGTIAISAMSSVQATLTLLTEKGTWALIAQGVAQTNITRGMALSKGAALALTGSLTSLSVVTSGLLLGLPLLAAGLTYAITSFYEQERKLTSLKADIEAELNETTQKQLSSLNKAVDKENQIFFAALDERFKEFNQYLAALKTLTNAANAEALKVALDPRQGKIAERDFEIKLISADQVEKLELTQEHITKLAEQARQLQLGGKLEEAAQKFRELESASKSFTDELSKNLNTVDKELKKLRQEKENKAFENSLVGLTDPAKIKKMTAYAEELFKKAEDFKSKGMFSDAAEELKETKKLAEKVIALSDADKKKNKGIGSIKGKDLSARAEDSLIALKEAEKKHLEELRAKALKQEQDIINQTVNGIDKQIAATKTLGEEWQKIQKTIEDIKRAVTETSKKELENKQTADLAANALSASTLAIAQGIKESPVTSANGKDFLAAGGRKNNKEFNERLDEIISRKTDLKNASPQQRNAILDQLKKDQEFISSVINTGRAASNDFLGGQVDLRQKAFGRGGKSFGETSQQTVFEAQELQKAIEAEKKSAAEKQSLLDTETQLSNRLGDITNDLKKFANSVSGVKAIIEQQLGNATNTFAQSVEKLPESAAKLIQAAAILQSFSVNGAGGVGKAAGGFAGGGLMGGGLGRDNQLFKGHSGEFMVNREAARNFTPMLTAINSGGNGARGLTSSGPTINVGDVHVHTPKGSTGEAVTAIGNQLRRAIRNRTVRLT